MKTSLLVTGFTMTFAAGCGLSQHVAERQALNQQTEQWAAQSKANGERYKGSATLYAGAVGMQPITTVPFSEAPAAAKGREWHCFEYRSRGRDPQTSSACATTLEGCRQAAAQRAERSSGSSREPVFYDVGTCAKQTPVTCTYLWFTADSGELMCHRAAADCKPLAYTMPGGAIKQSACGEVR
jgi:hypothetical protein